MIAVLILASLPLLPAAPVVSDQALADVRGKYVPPQSGTNIYRDALRVQQAPAASSPLAAAQTAGASPLSSIDTAHGQVTYFGIEMVSTWTQNNGAQGASVGVSAGFDLSHGTVTIGQWSSSTGGGLSTTPGTGSISGSSAANLSSGVGQNIQVAGNGNTISNAASVQVGASFAPGIVPTTSTCTDQCTVTIGANGIGIGISTPQGTVLQSIGPNGILQSAQVTSDANSINNQLSAQVRVTPSNSFNPGSLLPILQTLGGLP